MDKIIGTLRVATMAAQFDQPVVEGFDLEKAIAKIRLDGYFANGIVYIPHDKIVYIALIPANMAEATESGQVREALQ